MKKTAWAGIKKEKKLEDYLKRHDVVHTKYEATPALKNLTKYIKEDGIMRVPTCVIRNGSAKKVYMGFAAITRAVTAINESGQAGP